MKKALAVVLLAAVIAVPSFAQQKFALVIGNGAYTGNPWNSLRNSVKDATDVKNSLEKLGFQVEFIRNGNLNQMQTAVINLKQKLRASPQSYGFFYYAGHGAQNRDRHNYLIPVDADTPSLNLLPQRALPVQFVMDELEEAKNELNMIVLDACRDVPALDRSGSRGLSVEGHVPRGSIVMYATAANKTASDGTGQNGLFTGHLLKHLTTPGIAVIEIFDNTARDVIRETNGDQYPELRKMYYETAYLGTKPAAPVTVQPTPQPVPRPAPTPAPAVQPAAPPQRPVPDSMVRINGGTFTMGSPANELGRDSDEIQHRVTVSSFSMGKYPVTQKEYQEVTGSNPSNFKGDNLPVEQVSWFDAVEYCNKRSQREGLTPAYTVSGAGDGRTVTWNRNANGYRLPTEAEWEYACRAGTTTAYNTGAVINDNTGWYDANSGSATHPVGQKPANAWGLYDMHGNVWEWCWDWFGDYSSGAQTDPAGASSGSDRVTRGGSWGDSVRYVRTAYRGIDTPTGRNYYIGFRLVRP